MSRALRIEYADAWYHVMNRGAGKRTVFPDSTLRKSFLKLLKDIYERYNCHCHAYCLMGNHYHLLVQTKQPNLGRAMRHLDGVYTQRHNRHLETDGPLFRGRYKAQLVEHGNYLWGVSRYIHRNPLAAGLCNKLSDYPWSSFNYYLGQVVVPDWFQTQDTVARFGSTYNYCRFVEGVSNNDRQDASIIEPGIGKYPAVLGSTEFVTATEKRIASNYEIPDSKLVASTLSLEKIVEVAACSLACKTDEIYTPVNRLNKTRRAIVLLLAQQHGGFSLKYLANAFEMKSCSTVASAISRCLKKSAINDKLANQLNSVKEEILKVRNA